LALNHVSVRLCSDNAASVTAKSFWMSAHVHTCLAHVCVSGLFAIVLSLAFSHPPPPPIITSLCPLFLFCFLSRCCFFSPSLLSFLFYLSSSLALAVSLLSAAEWSRPEMVMVMQGPSQRKRAATQ